MHNQLSNFIFDFFFIGLMPVLDFICDCVCVLHGVVAAVVALWGGQTQSHAYAQEDAWNKTLAFLREHLYFNETLHYGKTSSCVISAE